MPELRALGWHLWHKCSWPLWSWVARAMSLSCKVHVLGSQSRALTLKWKFWREAGVWKHLLLLACQSQQALLFLVAPLWVLLLCTYHKVLELCAKDSVPYPFSWTTQQKSPHLDRFMAMPTSGSSCHSQTEKNSISSLSTVASTTHIWDAYQLSKLIPCQVAVSSRKHGQKPSHRVLWECLRKFQSIPAIKASQASFVSGWLVKSFGCRRIGWSKKDLL